MQINKIKLQNFRNHVNLKLDDLIKVNLIVGNNGVGKTSITEAINLSTVGRSFKTSDLNDLIHYDNNYSSIKINYKKQNEDEIHVNLSDKNTYLYNQADIKRNDLYGKIITLIFEPTIFSNFFSDKTYRRKYIDNEISKIYPIHKYNLNLVKGLDRDKKEILKYKYNEKLINIINKKLSKLYYQISDARSKFSNQINKYYFDILDTFNITFKKSSFEYESIFKNKNNEQILSILDKYNNEERKNKRLSNTINFDNFDILIDDRSVIKYGSQGQQRISFLSFIFSVAKLIHEKINFQPVIILDDVFSELDKINQDNLIQKFNDYGQFFITTTDNKILINGAKIINIKTHY